VVCNSNRNQMVDLWADIASVIMRLKQDHVQNQNAGDIFPKAVFHN
jgi:hypothetical protein